MLARTALGALNHVLEQTAWARQRLSPFSGRVACIRGGPLSLTFRVLPDGLLAETRDGQPAVTIELDPRTLADGLFDPARLMASARVSGPADFAETLGFVFRHLRWDAEADLARIVGDIGAHRISEGARRFVHHGRIGTQRARENLTTFLADGQAMVPTRAEATAPRQALSGLDEDIARLERRIAVLERRTASA